MSGRYSLIEIHTRESVRHGATTLYEAIIEFVRAQRVAARCTVLRGIAGCFEDGRVATQHIVDLSCDMPIKIEIVLPAAEAEIVLSGIEAMVTEGIVTLREVELRSHRARPRLLPPGLRVRDAMTPDPRRVRRDTPVADTVRLLLTAEFHGLPVVDDEDRPVGMITQGDLIARAGLPLRPALLGSVGGKGIEALLDSLEPRATDEIMTDHPVTVEADRPLTDAVDLLLELRLKRLPVVNEEGRLVGMLSRVDLFRALTAESDRSLPPERNELATGEARLVRDVMRQDMPVAQPDTPIEDLVRIIDANDLQRVAVVDDAGLLLGIVSDRDLLATISGQGGGLWDHIRVHVGFTEASRVRRELLKASQARTAGEVMHTDPIAVREDTPIAEAMELALEYRLKRLPVIEPNGRFLGVVSRDALLRAAFAIQG